MQLYQNYSKFRFLSKSVKSLKTPGAVHGNFNKVCQSQDFHQQKSLKRQGAANGFLPKLVQVCIFIQIDQILEYTRRRPRNFTRVCQSQHF